MSAPPPTTALPTPQKRDWVNVVFVALLASIIVGIAVYALWPVWFGDDSIVVEKRRESSRGHIVEHGRVYSQTQVTLPADTELVLPVTRVRRPNLDEVTPMIEIRVRKGADRDVARVLTETEINLGGHYGKTVRLSEMGRGTRVVKRQVGRVLTIDVDPGSWHWENAIFVRAIIVIPAGQKYRLAEPTAPEFTNRYKPEERIFWNVPDEEQRAAGWEEVPMAPLSHRQFRWSGD